MMTHAISGAQSLAGVSVQFYLLQMTKIRKQKPSNEGKFSVPVTKGVLRAWLNMKLIAHNFHKANFDHENDQFSVKTKQLVRKVTAQAHNRFVFVP